MRRVLGFAMCLVVGAVLSFIALAVRVLWMFPHEAKTDSAGDARWIAIGAFGFALACDAIRAYRTPPIPRALATRDR